MKEYDGVKMYKADRWIDYELIDAGNGEKLERWGSAILQRPDPQAIWPHEPWPKPDAFYVRSKSGGGAWKTFRQLPESWQITYPGLAGDLTFQVEPTGFKHTGLFPEQAVNWDYCSRKIMEAKKADKQVRVLNLFAYTGGATVACVKAGADETVHLDASKGMISWARKNASLSGVADKVVRYMVDDVQKFVDRELRRGRCYEGIIMDPPAYGRGPGGEMWKIEDGLFDLVSRCGKLLSRNALFFVVNAYSSGLAPTGLANIMRLALEPVAGGFSEAKELVLPASRRELVLPCGCTGRWER